jgi:hypothetical protein
MILGVPCLILKPFGLILMHLIPPSLLTSHPFPLPIPLPLNRNRFRSRMKSNPENESPLLVKSREALRRRIDDRVREARRRREQMMAEGRPCPQMGDAFIRPTPDWATFSLGNHNDGNPRNNKNKTTLNCHLEVFYSSIVNDPLCSMPYQE